MSKNPNLAKEWHPAKNGFLTPKDVTPGSNKKVWWKCSKGHKWEATVSNRTRGTGCPYCVGQAVCEENCLQTVNPAIVLEWHSIKNGTLTPKDITAGSGKKVWWICSKGHEWEAEIKSRTNGVGCPYCSGRAVCEDNCLQTVNPALTKEWHPTRNDSLTPKDVTIGSGKKVWWICSKGHEWMSTIYNRTNSTNSTGCPYCAGNLVCDDNCLQTVNPTLANEWHPNKNGSLTPEDVTHGSTKKVWWICNKGHTWKASVAHRFHGTGCPYCAGNLVCEDNCLQTVNPTLAKEWHPNKNSFLTPNDVVSGSDKKVWWLCNRGHEWEAKIYDRNKKGRGCPYCNSQTSQLELRIFTEMKYFFKKIKHRYKINGVECDIYIPDLNIGIEVDGFYWHKDKYIDDREKTNLLKRNNVILFRIREKGLKRVAENDVFFSRKDEGFVVLTMLFKKLLEITDLQDNIKSKIGKYLRIGKLANDDEYLKLLEILPSPLPGYSLQDCNAKLSKEWHPTKNGALTPWDVTPNSNMKVWWICSKGHEWEAIISNRNKGYRCPYCVGKFVNEDNSLQNINPNLAKEWHPTKNDSLTPKYVTPGSNKKVWWICSKEHEWLAIISNRNKGRGCPYCSGRAVCKDNCLQTVNTVLAKEWHPTKNESITPENITPNSGKKVWWMCSKGHEWKAKVANRNRGRGCPYCTGQARNYIKYASR